MRGLLRAAGIGGVPATLLHFGLICTAEQLTLPRIGVAPKLTEQAPEEVAIDVWHHVVYAEATGAAYEALFPPDRA